MRYAGVVVLMNPTSEINKNIKTYIDYVDKLYLIDNTPNIDNNEIILKNPKIVYCANKENLGIAKALNIGAELAIKEKYDWLLTMDQDSSFEKNHLAKMQEFIEKANKKNDSYKELNIDIKKVGIVAPFYKLNDSYNPRLGIDLPLMVMTSGNLIKLDAYQKIGGFKDWFFIDCVDFDYCLNLRLHDYEIVQLNNVVLNHHLGNTKSYNFLGRKTTSSNHSYLRKYYIVRNRHYIYDLYHNDFPEYCNLEIKQTKKEAIKIILFEKDKIRKIRYMIKGYLDYKRNIKGKLVVKR